MPKQIGRYRVLRMLGRGGMGVVYQAHDPVLDRLVALKVPFGGSAKARRRFYREARAAAGLRHPNICPVYDVGALEDGTPYLAMAFINGRPLSRVLAETRFLPPRWVTALLSKVARAMHEAHRQGIIHRDLKPGNILLDRLDEPWLLDFGLARCTDPKSGPLTTAGEFLGTLAYSSPEQLRGLALGPGSDVYSLGVVLYEMLTGRRPLPCVEHQPPSTFRPNISPGLDAICRKALEKSPDQRHQSMAELAAELEAWARQTPEAGGEPAQAAQDLP